MHRQADEGTTIDSTPRDSGKPIGKIVNPVASDTKRKVGGPSGAASAAEAIKLLSKKRKVPRMPKGWVYVEDNMEKIRVQEACNDKEIARLRNRGLLPASFEAEEVTNTPHSFRDEKKVMRSSRRIKTKINEYRSKAKSRAAMKKP
jgi:histone-lysine N-methyltransferase ASH1L